MSGGDQLTPPPVVWAQQAKIISLTICLEDCKKPTIEIHKDKIYFKGKGGTQQKTHEVTINLYKEIKPEESIHNIRDRVIEFELKKKEEGPFWPHLTKEKVKYHWLKLDFHKFNDESGDDDDDDALVDFEKVRQNLVDLKDYTDGDANNMPDFNPPDYNLDGADSDDSDLPDLE